MSNNTAQLIAKFLANGGKIDKYPPKIAQGNNFTKWEKSVIRASIRKGE